MDKLKYDNLEREKIKFKKELKTLEKDFYPKQKALKDKIAKLDELQRGMINRNIFSEVNNG